MPFVPVMLAASVSLLSERELLDSLLDNACLLKCVVSRLDL